MKISEIENLTFTELKSRHDELIAAMKDVATPELAARYVQARTDAKQRDEKMSEQGRTIKELQLALEATREREQAAVSQVANTSSENKTLGEKVTRLTADVQTAQARADRLKTQALRNQAAVTSAAKLLNDAITAQDVEAADKGE
jgi:predicted transcriptional regulator